MYVHLRVVGYNSLRLTCKWFYSPRQTACCCATLPSVTCLDIVMNDRSIDQPNISLRKRKQEKVDEKTLTFRHVSMDHLVEILRRAPTPRCSRSLPHPGARVANSSGAFAVALRASRPLRRDVCPDGVWASSAYECCSYCSTFDVRESAAKLLDTYTRLGIISPYEIEDLETNLPAKTAGFVFLLHEHR